MPSGVFKKYFLVALIHSSVCLCSSAVFAQATPNHVFQVSQNIRNELARMHEANLSQPKQIAPTIAARKPRHVLQKARELYLDVQKLRKSRGLKENMLQPLPVRAVKPQDVKGLVDKTLADLRPLRERFGSYAPEPATLPVDKKPTDVYLNLVKAQASISGLGIPKTVPNDVYRLTLSIIHDLEAVAAAKGVFVYARSGVDAEGKKPADVYEQAYQILQSLKHLVAKPGYQIAGGVVMPEKSSGRITPTEVIDIMNNILAEVGAIKNAVGVNTPTAIAPVQRGKTPVHVYHNVANAAQIVAAILAAAH